MILARVAARKNTKSATELNVQTFSNVWLLAGAVCILGLAAYAAILWRRVWQTKQQRQQQLSLQKSQRHDDLIVLSNGFLSGQMPWAEGCIRIKVILDHYDAEMGMHNDYHVLQKVFTATEQIPTHDA
jgi:Tfp pilus assembly protein PilN